MNAILLASAGLVILLIGGGIGFWAGRSGVGGGKARIEKAEADLEDYKGHVTDHFSQTAEHFQAIGKQYRDLYEHMASGAESLCEPDEAGRKLLFAPGAAAAAEEVEVADMQPPADYAEPIDDEHVIEGEPLDAMAEDVPEIDDSNAESNEDVLAADDETLDEASSADADVEDESIADVGAEPKQDEKSADAERTIH
ncbi:MAG: DUF1043 family protein [Pseudomonadota bacterium]